jgi:hypothetical protein
MGMAGVTQRLIPWLERENESIYALDNFIKKVGIPEVLLCDNDATMEGWSE